MSDWSPERRKTDPLHPVAVDPSRELSTSHGITDEEYNEYYKQIKESEGFDVVNIPNSLELGLITMLPCTESVLQHYIPYATLAIWNYNNRNRTNFQFKSIEKVNKQSAQQDELYITLQATDKDASDAANATKTFQAKVIDDMSGCLSESGYPKVIFEICRLKPTTNQGDSSKDSESACPDIPPSAAAAAAAGGSGFTKPSDSSGIAGSPRLTCLID